MITLTYGQNVPEAGDRGTPLFQALEDNITRIDGHSHNGIDSPLLTPQSFVGIADTITAAGWVAFGAAGHYRQLVTMHAGFAFDTCQISFRTTAGEIMYPTIERVSSTTYYIHSTNNTINVVAVYGG